MQLRTSAAVAVWVIVMTMPRSGTVARGHLPLVALTILLLLPTYRNRACTNFLARYIDMHMWEVERLPGSLGGRRRRSERVGVTFNCTPAAAAKGGNRLRVFGGPRPPAVARRRTSTVVVVVVVVRLLRVAMRGRAALIHVSVSTVP